jgi:hypothetical protein
MYVVCICVSGIWHWKTSDRKHWTNHRCHTHHLSSISSSEPTRHWNSFHIALQIEDVVDCLKVFYPQFEFVFLFDHSSQGHARYRNGALDAIQQANVKAFWRFPANKTRDNNNGIRRLSRFTHTSSVSW